MGNNTNSVMIAKAFLVWFLEAIKKKFVHSDKEIKPHHDSLILDQDGEDAKAHSPETFRRKFQVYTRLFNWD